MTKAENVFNKAGAFKFLESVGKKLKNVKMTGPQAAGGLGAGIGGVSGAVAEGTSDKGSIIGGNYSN